MKLSRFILASAFVLSSSAFALESMDDDSLSVTTGQDGLTFKISTSTIFEAQFHDTDGYAGAVSHGVLVMGGALTGGVKSSVATPLATTIDMVLDVGGTLGTAAGAGGLNINVTIPAGTVLHTGTFSLATGGVGAALTNRTNAIIDDMVITLGQTRFNVQLGSQPGSMIQVGTQMASGLNIANFRLRDPGGGGSLLASSLVLKNTGAAVGGPLTIEANADVTAAGLVITATQVGTLAGGFDQQITGLQLGSGSLGNVDMVGLNMNGTTVTIAGH